MTTKTKKVLGVIGFIVVVCIVAYFVVGTPGRDMEKLADEFCECKTIECRQEVAVKVEKLIKKHAGDKRDADVVDRWNKAQQRMIECNEKPL